MSKPLWPGVKRVRAKGRDYWYWTRSTPRVRLPSPYDEPDAFKRNIAHLQRVANTIEQRRREGTFGAVVKAYRTARDFTDLEASTQRIYDRYLNRLLAAYGDAPLVEMTPEDVQVRVLDANADTPGAADMMLTILRTLYRFANKRHRGLPDWTAGLEKYGNQSERQPWPEHVLGDALASDDAEFRLAVALHLYTGQRTGDCCAMTWTAAKGDEIAVVQEKTGTPLTIPFHPALKAELARAERKAVMILTNHRGGALTPGTFWKWCRAFSKPYGLRLGPHGLRKNATNELFEADCTAAQVAAVTGHKSLSMLEHYGKQRSQPKLGRAAIDKWGTKTEHEQENFGRRGKPTS